MGSAGVGWIAAIIIGGIAGWLAEQLMKSSTGMIMNIVLGIVGAAIASAILSYFGIVLGGWIGYLISGFNGAVLLIWIVRVIRPAWPREGPFSLFSLVAQAMRIRCDFLAISLDNFISGNAADKAGSSFKRRVEFLADHPSDL